MKKILNDRNSYVDETIEGILAAHPDIYRRLGESGRVIALANAPIAGKVGIVTGGGSGHLPVFLGYVGHGLLDACAVGNVFAGPRVDDCHVAMQAANSGAGVLQLFGNYGGDKMNFSMAQELAELDGIESTTVLVADDIASAPVAEREKRRGVAGLVYAYKIAGAKAAQLASLREVTATAQKATGACRSIGVALSGCVVPEAGKAAFEVPEGQVEFGMGIHGEPGIWRGELKSADALAGEMLDRLLAEVPLEKGSRISVLVNSLGATPLEELYILYRFIARELAQRGTTIVMPLIGRYATSMEMTGASLTLMPLDSELESLLRAPAHSPFWTVTA